MGKHIAVYSGSFDPLHIGHRAIMEQLTPTGGFDGCYLVVSPQNPLKSHLPQHSARERYHNAIAAVSRCPGLRVWVDDIEFGLEPPFYTIRTLDALKAREPDNRFTLVIGADNLSVLRQWRDYRRILLEYGVAVYPRTGFDLDALRADLLQENSLYDIAVIEAPLVDISSTRIREGMARGEDMSAYLM